MNVYPIYVFESNGSFLLGGEREKKNPIIYSILSHRFRYKFTERIKENIFIGLIKSETRPSLCFALFGVIFHDTGLNLTYCEGVF